MDGSCASPIFRWIRKTGILLHAGPTAGCFCGYGSEPLRKPPSGKTRSVRAYARHSPGKAAALFFSVYELAC